VIVPIGDDNRDRRLVPFVTYLIIAANILVFVLLQGLGGNVEFTYSFSTVPEEIISGRDVVTEDRVFRDPLSGDRYRVPGLQPTPISVYITLITAMFMHGGLGHIIGNLLFLWVFGDNLEDFLGHGRYLLFYLATGILASLAHVYTTVLTDANMLVPMLGASGAISGVLGGYLMLFPRRRVWVLLFRFIVQVPAIVAIGIWFVFQLVSGLGLLGAGTQAGGVAYAAHIGGFVAGFLLIRLFSIARV
jgi:membrane associated rhomboid family serine protease